MPTPTTGTAFASGAYGWTHTSLTVNAGGARTNRYLDPPTVRNDGNAGALASLGVTVDHQATARDRIQIGWRESSAGFQVPNDLEQERAEARDAGAGSGVEHIGRLLGVDDGDGDNGDEPADELRDPVRNDLRRRELARHGEPERHGGVEVTAGEMPERRDGKREPETERERDPEAADRPAADVDGDGNRVEAEEEEQKRAEDLRGEPQGKR